MIKIPLKWVGGKRREVKFYKDWLNIEYSTYIEPFAGGLANMFYMNPSPDKRIIVNDLNNRLVNFYKEFAFNRDSLIEELKEMKNEESEYYFYRDCYNGKQEPTVSDAALFMYLNKTSFSGMQRFNSKGEFNTPFGRYKNFNPWDSMTEETAELLRRTEILNEDFEEIFKLADKDSFIFLDPPYLSTFSAYVVQKDTGKSEFEEPAHIRLANCFKTTEAKCLMIVSDLGIIRKLYEGYIKGEYDKNYAINVKNRMKDVTEAKHLIIANYDIHI